MSENWHKVEATTVGCTPPPSLPKTVEKDPGKPDLGEAATPGGATGFRNVCYVSEAGAALRIRVS